MSSTSAAVPRKPSMLDLYSQIQIQREASQEDLDARRNERDAALAQAQAATARVNDLSSQRAELNGQLDELNAQNEEMQAEYELIASQYAAALIAKAEALDRYVESQDNLAATELMFSERVSVMFEYQNKSTLEIILESDSLAGFFTNIELISLIADADDQAVDQMQIALDDARVQEERALAEAEEMEAIAEQKQDDLRALEEQIGITTDSIADLDWQISSAQSDAATFNAQVADLNSQIDQIQSEIYAQQAAAQSSSSDNSSSSSAPADNSTTTGEEMPESTPDTPQPSGPSSLPVSLSWPSYSYNVTSPFGYRYHPITGEWKGHTGIDIGADFGDSIMAAASGTVSFVNCPCPGSNYTDSSVGGGYGNYLMIDHGNGVVTLYGHCRDIYVSSGEYVSQGQVIAEVGSTGGSTGPHLHFEVRYNGQRVDPMQYF
jgi:murein DD-endopeptidase MepM/ murein hydrolase activator NlpD